MEIAEFLRRYPPFAQLSEDRLRRVARSVMIAHFPAGIEILSQDGVPADALHVIRKGAVELLDDGEPLDLLTEGEVFGQFSILTHERPALTVRAHEDTLCYLLPEPVATEVLGTGAGHSFLSSSLRQRLRLVAEHVRPEPGDPRYRQVGSLVRRSVVKADAGMTIAAAAARMAAERVSCLLVPMHGAWGIVTDRDLRTRVIAVGADHGSSVESIATYPVRTVPTTMLAGDALTEMLATGVHHLPVTDAGGVVGVVTDTDLMGIGHHTPFALKSAISRARDASALAAAGRDLPELVVALVEASTDPVDVGRVIALVTDALTDRSIELAIDELGDPPAPFAWLALGSAARYEQSLTSDQDHALVYEASPGDDAELERYFSALAAAVTDGLEAAGIPRCPGEAMAVHAPMRQPLAIWEDHLRACLAGPSAGQPVLTSIAFDQRRQAGALDAEGPLDAVLRGARQSSHLLRHLARRALASQPPTGFFGDLVVERRGDHAGRLDVKRGGIAIVTDLARVWGLAAGTGARDTIGRLEAAADVGSLDAAVAREMSDAFRFLWDLRLQHQAEQVRAGEKADDAVDPRALGTVARSGLKEAFRVIRGAQRLLANDLGIDPR